MGKAGASSGGLCDPPPHPTFPGSYVCQPAALGPLSVWPWWVARVGANRPFWARGVPPPSAAPLARGCSPQTGWRAGGTRTPPPPSQDPHPHSETPLPEQAVIHVQERVVGELSTQQSPSEGWAASAANADRPKRSAGPMGGALSCTP